MSQLHTQEAELQATCQKKAPNSSLMHIQKGSVGVHWNMVLCFQKAVTHRTNFFAAEPQRVASALLL